MGKPGPAGALEVGPGGALFVGDSQGSAVWALAVDPPAASGSGAIARVEDLDEKIAALLGTGPRDVLIQDMAVHQPSDIVAAHRGEGITKKAGPRTGVEDNTVPVGNLAQAAEFDADHIAVLGRSMDNGSLYLATIPKRRL